MIAVHSIIFAETRIYVRKWIVIVEKGLSVSLMVETAGCIVGLRTKSAIVTGGRVLIDINLVIPYYSLLLESNSCCKQQVMN